LPVADGAQRGQSFHWERNVTVSPIGAAIVPVTSFQQNTTILWCTATMKATVVDPGGEIDRLLATAQENGARIEQIWLTHGHLDHAGGAAALKRATGAPIIGPHKDDKFWLDRIPSDAAQFGMTGFETPEPDQWLDDGDRVTIGALSFDVVHCPGHTPGHVVFANRDLKLAFVGDVLFRGSVGRTDFPRGNTKDLVHSITKKLWPLGDDMRFVPGHGPMSTFLQERRSNPFVGDAVVGAG
jgi:glyoxylase-like metal-dependent hydrolase (beta-lactamase superfamily II)